MYNATRYETIKVSTHQCIKQQTLETVKHKNAAYMLMYQKNVSYFYELYSEYLRAFHHVTFLRQEL